MFLSTIEAETPLTGGMHDISLTSSAATSFAGARITGPATLKSNETWSSRVVTAVAGSQRSW